jgi:hypothetical protein
MDTPYVRLQKEAQRVIEELQRRKALVVNTLDTIAQISRTQYGVPLPNIWFEVPAILPPEAEWREIDAEMNKPRERHERAARALTRDPHDGNLKINIGLRVITARESYVETSVPITVRVEGTTLHFTLPKPDQTEVTILANEFPEDVKEQQMKLLSAVMREVKGFMEKFLTGGARKKIGFYESSGESI